ncbi:unnamed protein product [Spirodela intermedia]|uniref:Uncharacterized protein n=1 Tax=Spirodela intermedia TaxID=51605 RepID=A0ABN7EEK1_SPIIN|nr:unnamed protein product [Spirodela intermedia]
MWCRGRCRSRAITAKAPAFATALCLILLLLVSRPSHSELSSIHRPSRVLLSRIGDRCTNAGLTQFTNLLTEWSGSTGHCIEIGDGSWDSWIHAAHGSANAVCEKVNEPSLLPEPICRRGSRICDGGPPVKNFISLGGPHAGIASVPLWWNTYTTVFLSLRQVSCALLLEPHQSEVYSDYDIPDYLEKCRFLPKLNNERPSERNSTYKDRLAAFRRWKDWIGLKVLNEAGRVKFVSVAGNHLGGSLGLT